MQKLPIVLVLILVGLTLFPMQAQAAKGIIKSVSPGVIAVDPEYGGGTISFTETLSPGIVVGSTVSFDIDFSSRVPLAVNIILISVPLSLQQQIQLIIDRVSSLVSAANLNQGQGNALTSKLNAAIQQVNHENSNAAAGQLQAFTNQVSAFVSAGILSSAAGQSLLDSATAVIGKL